MEPAYQKLWLSGELKEKDPDRLGPSILLLSLPAELPGKPAERGKRVLPARPEG